LFVRIWKTPPTLQNKTPGVSDFKVYFLFPIGYLFLKAINLFLIACSPLLLVIYYTIRFLLK